jgi:hypothetical protein
MTLHSEESQRPGASGFIDYKHEFVRKLDDLRKYIQAAPADLDLPKETILGVLTAAVEFINCGADPSKEHAEQRARAALSAALTPLGLYVGHRAYPLLTDH